MNELQFTFKRRRIDKISKSKMIEELKKVAEFYRYYRFTRHDYDKIAKVCKGTAILTEFGNWQKALDAIDVKLKPKKIDCNIIQEQELFDEMKKIWISLGHRPSKTEWDLAKPRYSYSTYKRRFGSWTNACLRFIEYRMEKISCSKKEEDIKNVNHELTFTKIDTVNQLAKREIPLKTWKKVMIRDNFCCTSCGKSPVTHDGTKLHIDHIHPYSKGGKTEINNLQVLCAECNWKKGNKA